MYVMWTSPHCRPDWLNQMHKESQGGQSVAMNTHAHALTRVDSQIHVDIFTRLQDSDPQATALVKILMEILVYESSAVPVAPLTGISQKNFSMECPLPNLWNTFWPLLLKMEYDTIYCTDITPMDGRQPPP